MNLSLYKVSLKSQLHNLPLMKTFLDAKKIHALNFFFRTDIKGSYGILFPKLFWLKLLREKIVLVIYWEKLLKLEAEGREFWNFWDTRPIYSNNERSVQFLKLNVFWSLDLLEAIQGITLSSSFSHLNQTWKTFQQS